MWSRIDIHIDRSGVWSDRADPLDDDTIESWRKAFRYDNFWTIRIDDGRIFMMGSADLLIICVKQ